ncbi:cell division protein PerM [Corynebacterium atrinae]|uniref:cell division protein PerM n=1 Tax=Corynebacterium atrinae TaxID=1336740 RepID=UPI0025B58D42|nr:DUF6350 family protein [Corynebacterium atrinae]
MGGKSSASSSRTPDVAPEAPLTIAGRLRRYVPVVAIPLGIVVLGLIVVSLAGLMVTGLTLTAFSATVAQLWLVLNLVPVNAADISIGVLPLLPTIALIAFLARRIHRAVRDRVSVADLLVLAAATLFIPIVLTLIASGMMWDAGRVFDVGAPPLGHAIGRTLLVHAIALVIGMGGRLWRALLSRYGAPEWLVDAAVVAVRIFTWLALASLVLFAILLATGWSRQVEMAQAYSSAGGVVGAIIVSLLYLPNALIWSIAVLLGSEFHFGAASISLYAINLVSLPPLPLLALIPGAVQQWAIGLLAVVAAVCAYVHGRMRPGFRQALASGAIAALVALVACYLTSGGVGYFGKVGPMLWMTVGLAFVWVAGVGLVAAAVGLIADRRAPAVEVIEPEPEPEPEPEAEPEREEEEEEILEGEIVSEEAPEEVSEEPKDTVITEDTSVTEDGGEDDEKDPPTG